MKAYETAVALVLVTDTEEAAAKHMYPWTERRFPDDEQVYYEAEFTRNGVRRRVVYARQDEMGMTAGAVLSMKLIERYRPEYLIMVGIAAGVAQAEQEEQIYGDVIVADVIWNYSVGKFVPRERAEIQYGDVGFIPRPRLLEMPDSVRPYVEAAAHSEENQCHVYIGPMACGTTVVANREILDKQVRSQVRHTAGLDMESYAIAYAAAHASQPRPTSLIIKSVCDYADAHKSDQYQKFAAFTSCEFAQLLYERFLPYTGAGERA